MCLIDDDLVIEFEIYIEIIAVLAISECGAFFDQVATFDVEMVGDLEMTWTMSGFTLRPSIFSTFW